MNIIFLLLKNLIHYLDFSIQWFIHQEILYLFLKEKDITSYSFI